MEAIVRKTFRGGTEVSVAETEAPTFEARVAIALIEKWGMVLCEFDGEDSSGRQKMKLKSPEDVVKQAFNTAALAVEEIRSRGLMIDIPLPIMPEEE